METLLLERELSNFVMEVSGTMVLPLKKRLIQMIRLEYICISVRAFQFQVTEDLIQTS